MIKKKMSVIATLLLLGSVSAFGGVITGSPHDLSANADSDAATADNGELCVYCHTPHAGNSDFNGAPLWNKATLGTTPDYFMYGQTVANTAGTTIAGTSTDATPASPSLACLSCHDGISAVDSIVNAPGSGMNTVAGSNDIVAILATAGVTYGGNIGGTPGDGSNTAVDLANDHPVSIVYTEGAASLRLKTTVLADVTTTEWVGATTINDLLRSGKVECGSCHDPHNGGNTQGTSTEVNFLRHSNAGSKLCIGCHDK